MTIFTSDTTFFVKSSKEVVDTLFAGPKTATGTFQIKKNGVLFFDLTGVSRVFLCANDPLNPFFVSCSQVIDKNGRKRIRYMQTLCALDELFLDVRGFSYTEERYLASAIWNRVKQSK